MKTIVTVPTTLEQQLGIAQVKTETRISRNELRGMFAIGSRRALVATMLGDNGSAPRPRTVLRHTSYGFEFDAGGGKASSLRFESGDYIVLGQRDGKAEITIRSKDGGLSAQYIPAEAERIITLKCESDSPSYDQRPRRVIVKEETAEKWIGWPEDWRKRGVVLEPMEWPKFAWKEIETLDAH
jgi:hypothetical protein